MVEDVVILDGARTPIGTFGGALAGTPPTESAAHVVRHALSRSGVEGAQIGTVVFGNVIHTEAKDMYLSRVAAVGQRRGDHHRHSLADMAHPVRRQNRARGTGGGGSVEVLHGAAVHVVDHAVQRVRRQHRQHAGRGARRLRIDRGDGRMSDGGAHEHGARFAGLDDVLDIAPGAAQEARVLDAGDGLAEAEFRHGNSSWRVGLRSGGQVRAPFADCETPLRAVLVTMRALFAPPQC
ncbi:MAG: hypothetical protein CO163_12015 [Rhodobacterales bacterium CG_4_9_14_3_um_filter_71_31]|nr:MAG: hypothetical protein CO163_12015 [Rhodobacterales bacterium CG_4_9_14_3_um_filter_71_31]